MVPAGVTFPGKAKAAIPLPDTLADYRGRSTACVAALFKCAYDDDT